MLFSIVVISIYIPTNNVVGRRGGSLSSTPSEHLLFAGFLMIAILTNMR